MSRTILINFKDKMQCNNLVIWGHWDYSSKIGAKFFVANTHNFKMFTRFYLFVLRLFLPTGQIFFHFTGLRRNSLMAKHVSKNGIVFTFVVWLEQHETISYIVILRMCEIQWGTVGTNVGDGVLLLLVFFVNYCRQSKFLSIIKLTCLFLATFMLILKLK